MIRGHESVDGYLAVLSVDKRVALEKLRRAIRAIVPDAEECISYQVPAFRHGGRMLVGFGATKTQCAFYLMSAATLAVHRDVTSAYDTSKGTIRFAPDKPLPVTLVRRLVKARLAENASKSAGARRG